MAEKRAKEIFFSSIGITISEIKKSFLLSFVYALLFFGAIYFFYLVNYILYFAVDTTNIANIWLITIIVSLILALIFLFGVLSRIKKCTLLKILLIETTMTRQKSKLVLFDKIVTEEFANRGKIKQILLFFFTILILGVIDFFIAGIYFFSVNVWLQIILFGILFFTLIPFSLFILFWNLYTKEFREVVLSCKLFIQNYKLLLSMLVINSILILLLLLISYLLPNFNEKIYLVGFIGAIFFCILCYFNFFCLSQVFVKEQMEEEK